MKVPKLTQTYCGACGRAEAAVSAGARWAGGPKLGQQCPAGAHQRAVAAAVGAALVGRQLLQLLQRLLGIGLRRERRHESGHVLLMLLKALLKASDMTSGRGGAGGNTAQTGAA